VETKIEHMFPKVPKGFCFLTRLKNLHSKLHDQIQSTAKLSPAFRALIFCKPCPLPLGAQDVFLYLYIRLDGAKRLALVDLTRPSRPHRPSPPDLGIGQTASSLTYRVAASRAINRASSAWRGWCARSHGQISPRVRAAGTRRGFSAALKDEARPINREPRKPVARRPNRLQQVAGAVLKRHSRALPHLPRIA